jgi:hypothetical protein
MTNLTTAHLRQALALRENIDALETELSELLGGIPTRVKGTTSVEAKEEPKNNTKNLRRPMSMAVKVRMAAAARKRWRLAKAAGKRTLGG